MPQEWDLDPISAVEIAEIAEKGAGCQHPARIANWEPAALSGKDA